MTKKLNVYLCGCMDYATEEYQTTWRAKAEEYFKTYEVNTLNPCRRPHTSDLTPKEVFNLDIIDLNNSDILLYDFRQDNIPQFGSPSEIMYFSYVLKRPVIGWYEKGIEPTKKGIFQQVLIDRHFPSLEEACDHITGYYL